MVLVFIDFIWWFNKVFKFSRVLGKWVIIKCAWF